MNDNFTAREEDNAIRFLVDGSPENTLKLENGFFWYRGEKIEDINFAYERFCKWLEKSELDKE